MMIFIGGVVTGAVLAWIIMSILRILKVHDAGRKIRQLLREDPHGWWCLQDFMPATACDSTCLYHALANLVERGEVIKEQRVSSFRPPLEYKLNLKYELGAHVPGYVRYAFQEQRQLGKLNPYHLREEGS
jgi:hypothetical protein